MAAPVWVLSVDLQTKTASFTTGLADAARGARTSFKDISDGAKKMGAGVAEGGTNVRAAIGLIDNVIRGAHSMAMADLVREFSNTKIVMAALPFAATVAGFIAVAGLAVEAAMAIKEMREQHEKLTEEETRFGTAVNSSFRTLDDRLLEAEKKSDELRNDHLGALRKELELIDHTSMAEIMKEFDLISKAADAVFGKIQSHWYTFGVGSIGASHALEQFSTQYKALLAQGKDKEASDLLAGTRQSAEHTLAMLRQAKDSLAAQSGKAGTDIPDQLRYAEAKNALSKAGLAGTKDELAAQETLVKALQAQETAQAKIAALRDAEGNNAKKSTSNDGSARASEAARAAVASRLAIAEQVIAGDRAVANAQMEIQRASVATRLQSDLAFAQREYDTKMAANAQMAGALDKSGKDYQNQLKQQNEKGAELTASHAAEVQEITSRATVEQAKRDLATLEAGERDKIAATQEGSAERMAAIEAGIRLAQQMALQDTDFYRTLGTERVQLARQMGEEEAKQKAQAGKIAADNEMKLGAIELAAKKEAQALQDSFRRVTEAQQLAEDQAAEDAEFALKMAANAQEQAALDSHGKDYTNKLQELQNREIQLIREHEIAKTSLKDRAEQERNIKIRAAESSLEDTLARGLTSTLMRHQSFAAAMSGIGDEVASGMMQTAIKSVMAMKFSKEEEAASAARQAYLAGMKFPFPANIVAAPVMAAGAFASVMAFATGTDSVPGHGRGDVVPAMLTPGEGVVPGGVMDGLRTVAKNGGFDKGQGMTIHPTFAPNISALDATGVDKVLTKHAKTFQKHFEITLRKLNR